MTENEHRLVASMFIQQEIRFKALLELLRSRGIDLGHDDLAAFESLVREKMESELTWGVVKEYRELAESLGLRNDLPELGPY